MSLGACAIAATARRPVFMVEPPRDGKQGRLTPVRDPWCAAGPGPTGSKPFAQPGEERPPDAELRRADADAGAVAQLVLLVGDVEHVEPCRHVAERAGRELLRHAE